MPEWVESVIAIAVIVGIVIAVVTFYTLVLEKWGF